MFEYRFDAALVTITEEEFGFTVGFCESADFSGRYVILTEDPDGCYLELNDQCYSSYGDIRAASAAEDVAALELRNGFSIEGKRYHSIKIGISSFKDGPEPLQAALDRLIY